jgi:superfamily II DNA or RNA helicase
MSLRDIRQKEFAQEFLDRKQSNLFGVSNEGGGILHLCPRFGKCRTAIHIFKTVEDAKILIAYPDIKIKQSWLDEFKKVGYVNKNITFTTHLSLKKHKAEPWDLIVLDEIHLLSDAQIGVVQDMGDTKLGLTGTLSHWTERELRKRLGLEVVARYPMELAIAEGVITDYEINVVTVPLDDKIVQTFGTKRRTEKRQYDAYTWAIGKLMDENRDTKFVRLGRMRTIQGSLAKVRKTKELLQKFKGERILVFCGLTKVADSLGIPSYHSKKEEKQIFEDFLEGKGDQMAVVKIGNTGSTYKPLNKIIINYFDSNAETMAQKINRCMGMEYDNPDKKAIIYIVCSTEEQELKWLQKGLEFFEKDKIKYL